MLSPEARALCVDISSVVALNLGAFLWFHAGKPSAGEAQGYAVSNYHKDVRLWVFQ